MSTHQNRPLLLAPILLTLLAAGSVHAKDVAKIEGQIAPITVTTTVTRADVEFNVQAAAKFLESAKTDAVAVQCALYSVDSGGKGHCAFYDSESAGPVANNVGMSKFDV